MSMRIKWTIYIGLLLIVILAGCTAEDGIDNGKVQSEPIKMTGFRAVISGDAAAGTREPAALAIELGRANFVANDQVVFTQIKRTTDPIAAYTYNGVVFNHDGSKWNKSGDTNLYWSDATNEHTFIAYSKPNESFDWNESERVYSGTIGDGGTGEQVVFSSLEDLKNEDLLIAYSTTMTENSGSVPLVEFHHALSSVRVEVHLENFPTDARVTDLIMLHQPTKYQWNQTSWGVEPVAEGDQVRKKFQLFIPESEGTNSNTVFTFYGMVIPQISTYTESFAAEDVRRNAEFTFNVKYTEESISKTVKYKASHTIHFEAGNNITLKITAQK